MTEIRMNRIKSHTEINSEFLFPIFKGMVFSPAVLSTIISRMSNGIVMAKTNKKRSVIINSICVLSKPVSEYITGSKTVNTDHTIEIKKIFKNGISLILKILLPIRDNGVE